MGYKGTQYAVERLENVHGHIRIFKCLTDLKKITESIILSGSSFENTLKMTGTFGKEGYLRGLTQKRFLFVGPGDQISLNLQYYPFYENTTVKP